MNKNQNCLEEAWSHQIRSLFCCLIEPIDKGTMLAKIFHQDAIQKTISHLGEPIAVDNIAQGLFFDVAQIDHRVFVQTTRHNCAIGMDANVIDRAMTTTFCTLMGQ